MARRAPKNGTHYTYRDRPPRVRVDGFEKSRTRQSEAAACDINNIMRRYEQTGVLPVDGREAFYADVSQMGDYRTALEQVRLANEAFLELPAGLRRRFDNDPAAFLDFTSDPANRKEMQELGLIEPDPVVEGPPGPAENVPAAAETPPGS